VTIVFAGWNSSERMEKKGEEKYLFDQVMLALSRAFH
jgi:hypothetical protein